jgi:hypothetical protein
VSGYLSVFSGEMGNSTENERGAAATWTEINSMYLQRRNKRTEAILREIGDIWDGKRGGNEDGGSGRWTEINSMSLQR